MNKNLRVNITKTMFSQKPAKKEIALVQKEIKENTEMLTVEDLAERLTRGAAFKPAYLNHGTKAEDWTEQQIFCLDFDNDNPEKSFSIFNALGRCTMYNIIPSFCYQTFSDTDETNFRLVFITDVAITDIRIRNAVQLALMTIFPESDRSCKDCARIFFGTDKRVRFKNYDKTLDVETLMLSMCSYLKNTDKTNNYNRQIKNYCQAVGLNIINNLPDIKTDIIDNIENDKIDEMAFNSIYIYRTERENVKKVTFNFNIEKEQAIKITTASEGKKNFKKSTINAVKQDNKEELIQHFDFNELQEKCMLFNDFMQQERVHHEQIFGMATNLWRVKGAEQKMIDTIIETDSYENTKENKVNTIINVRKYAYAPQRCENFCPYHNICEHQKNMLQQVELKRANIRRIKDNTDAISLTEAEQQLQDALNNAINSKENNVFVIKACTGLGKTTALAHLNNYNNTVISYPNHRLGEDIINRLNIEDAIQIKELKLNNKEIQSKFDENIRKGAFKNAYTAIQNYRDIVCKKINNNSETEEERQDFEVINEYLETKNISKTTNKLIFCTHSKMLNLDNENVNTYIVDEDILKSSLIETIEIDLAELHLIKNLCKKAKYISLEGCFNDLIETTEKALENVNTVQETSSKLVNSKELKELINYNVDKLDSNLLKLVKVSCITVTSDGKVLGAIKNELRADKKYIILSATANKTIYERFFSDRKVVFTDISNVQEAGQLILHYTSCSRASLNKKIDKIIDKVKEETNNTKNLITFMKYEHNFEKAGFNIATHFGATEGLDMFKGQDLVIVGTPHINNSIYMLFATLLGEKFIISDEIIYKKVKRNNFEFYFNTYELNEFMQEIQFYLIESELVQAIGRARLLRTNATVHLFSNLPLPSCKLYKEKNY